VEEAMQNNEMVPFAAPHPPSMVRFNKGIERRLLVSSQKIMAGQILTTLATQQNSQAIGAVIAEAATGYARNKQLIDQAGLPDEIAEPLNTVNHNTQMAILNRAEGINQLHDYLLKESLKLLLEPDSEWEDVTIGMKLKNLFTWGEEELHRKYGVRLSLGQSILNAATLGMVADAKRRRIEQVMGSGNGLYPR
jgi:hypothetical protein